MRNRRRSHRLVDPYLSALRQPFRSPRASIARAAVAALGVLALPALVAISCGRSSAPGAVSFDGPTAGWASYGGDPGGMRYSLLTQIDRSNVDRLEEAWTFHTGEPLGDRPFAFEVTPILVGERLVLCTPWNRVIALDPETGAEL